MSDSTPIRTLMVIDDDEVDQMMYSRLIQRSGIVKTTIQFRLATEALAYLRRPDCEPIDLIVLDINMPIMNGLEFLEAATQELGATFSAAVVIMLTTSLNPDDMARSKAFSVVKDFQEKPLTIETIMAWPDTVLKRVSDVAN